MATTYTENYHLGKQEEHSDRFSMKVITDNMDIIDSVLATKLDKSEAMTDGWIVATESSVEIGTEVEIPENWKEVQAIVAFQGTNLYDNLPIITSKTAVVAMGGQIGFTVGWGSTSTLYANVTIKETSVKFEDCVLNGTRNNNARMWVFYKQAEVT